MDFEKKFFEFLRSDKARQIIKEIANEKDAKKLAELQEQLRLYEDEKNRYLNAYQESRNDLKRKEVELENLQTEIEILKKDKGKVEAELSEERMAHKRTVSELTVLKSDFDGIKEELDAIKTGYERLQKSFEGPIFCYEQYSKLSESTKDGLSNVISCKSVSLFIATCTNADNLKKVWEYTKEILGDNSKHEDVEILKLVFDYFFDLYNQSLVEPSYKRDKTDVGDDYDDEYHVRSRESATSGRISKVLLKGYSSINTGRIICKSVVSV